MQVGRQGREGVGGGRPLGGRAGSCCPVPEGPRSCARPRTGTHARAAVTLRNIADDLNHDWNHLSSDRLEMEHVIMSTGCRWASSLVATKA